MSTGKVQASVKRSRNVNTFAELSHANRVLLENTEQERDGWFYECLTTIVIAAFKFEAYLNHVGKAIFSDYWNEMERLSPRNKCNIICAHLHIVQDKGKRPWQTLSVLFKFRNAVAHGKDEFLDPPETVEKGEKELLRRQKPLTWWERLCTIEFARRVYDDTEAIMKQIHSTADLDEADFRRSGHSYSIGIIKGQ